MRLLGYVRVSTDAQRERYGPASQRADMTRWAREHGHTITGWCSDAISGVYERMSDRDGWADALRAVDHGDADGMIVARLDRLARDTIAQELLLRDCGWRLYSALDGENAYIRDDPDDPTRKLVRTIFGAIATYDREMTVAKLRSARRAKRAAGGHAQGQLPYGYRASPRSATLAPDPAQQTALARMRELAGQGSSTRAIAAVLTAEGHPTARGGAWSSATIARILKRANEKTAPTTGATEGK